jgi:hypothetical protein
MTLTDDQVLWAVSEHGQYVRDAVWLRNIRFNKQTFGFDNVLKRDSMRAKPCVAMAVGSAYKALDIEFERDLKTVFEAQKKGLVKVIACDLSLPHLATMGFRPDVVVSVDAHPVVANFYRRSGYFLDGIKVCLPTTIHYDVVNECLNRGAEIYWWQSHWGPEYAKFQVHDVPHLMTGGTVGTTAFLLAHTFRCSPVGMLGLEFAWSDETPYFSKQFFNRVREAVGWDIPVRRGLFKTIENPRDKRRYLADPTYLYYLRAFKDIWMRTLKLEQRRNSYNLTPQGILSAHGLKCATVEEFLGLIQ